MVAFVLHFQVQADQIFNNESEMRMCILLFFMADSTQFNVNDACDFKIIYNSRKIWQTCQSF